MKMELHPTTRYNRYIGKKIYRFSRKYLGKSKLLALGFADLPASLVIGGIVGLVMGDVSSGILAATTHQGFMTTHLYMQHKYHKQTSRNKRELREILGRVNQELKSKLDDVIARNPHYQEALRKAEKN